MSRNKSLLNLARILPILLIIACGSSGGGNSGDNGTSISGIAADGYLRNATVCLDIDNNGRCDDGEPSTTTGEGGAYTLNPGDYAPEAYPVVVEVSAQTIDEDDNQTVGVDYTLRAPAGKYGFVTPLTTLIQTKIDQNPALDADAAAQLIGLQLNVEDPDKLYEDYVAGAGDGELDTLHQGARMVAQAFGEVRTLLSGSIEDLEDDYELQAVQVITGKLLLSRLDHVAAAVQEGVAAVGDPVDGVATEAALLDAEEISKVADQMRVLGSATVTNAYATLQGKTLYAFEEGGDEAGTTIVFFDRFVIGTDAATVSDADLRDMSSFTDLTAPEETEGEDFANEAGVMVFEDQEYITAVSVDLNGLTFKLADLAQVKMQDTDLRAEEVTFGAGDVMYKVKGLYPPSDVPTLALDLYDELADEEEGYSEGNGEAEVIAYAAARDVNNPIWDHGIVLGEKVYLKYFEPSAPGSPQGTLKGVSQTAPFTLDTSDTITIGAYEIRELGDGRAYIVMDFDGFAEIGGAFDYLLIVNDAMDNHDHEEIVIGTGAKSTEKIFFNESAMEKIFNLIDSLIDYIV